MYPTLTSPPRCISFFAGLLAVGVAVPVLPAKPAAERFEQTFAFDGRGGPGAIEIRKPALFEAQAGHGFESVNFSAVEQDSLGIRANKPYRFSVGVPEGNYEVSVNFDAAAMSSGGPPVTIRAESRRLMIEGGSRSAGQDVGHGVRFVVAVRDSSLPPPPLNAPGGNAVLLNPREEGSLDWDSRLTLEFGPSDAAVSSIRIRAIDCPTIYLAGDSTVTDQPYEPGASWGQMLPRFFKPTVAVANHAESGETLKSFLSELRLAKVLTRLGRGDYLFIQFGHNDSKKQWPQTYVEAHTTYKAYLKAYIAEARLRGATPVLVTSMQRRTFDDSGKIRNSHGDYPEAVRAVAREEKVALIDLDRMSVAFYEALGREKAPLAFSNGGKDPTHHNNYGAYELAKCVVEGIRAAGLPLASELVDDLPRFDPHHPDPVEGFELTPSPERSEVAPRGN